MKSKTAGAKPAKPNNPKREQAKEGRLEIVSKLYRRGYSLRKICSEVKEVLQLNTYSLSTAQSDVKTLLEEWRAARLENVDDLVQVELERIDEAVQELWQQWEVSKTYSAGAPSYIAEIRQQLAERRKLLGLYAAEKHEVTQTTLLHKSPCDMSVEEIENEMNALRLNK